MTREEAYEELTSLIKNPNLIKHHLAAEAVMRALYRKFNAKSLDPAQEERWGMVGLLHDADYELTKDQPERHTLELEKLLGNKLDEGMMHAIKSHNFARTGVEPNSTLDWSIYACDELTGLIIASALVHPDKKLKSLTSDFVLNRFKESSFAKGADRKQIKACEEHLGIPLKEFVEINLKAMQGISQDLGL